MFEKEIKAALQKAGLPEGLAAFIAVEKVEEIDAKVEALKGNLPKPDAPKFAKLDEVFSANPELKVEFDKALTAEGDRRVNDTKKMRAEKEKSNEGLTDVEKTVKELVGEALEPLKTMLTQQQSEVKRANSQREAQAALKEAGLPEKAIGMINFDSETAIKEQVEHVKGIMQEHTQSLNDQLLAAGVNPGASNAGANVGDSVVKQAAESLNSDKAAEAGGFNAKKID